MRTRDVGTSVRVLVLWGYSGHACQTANGLIDLVFANDDGFLALPGYSRGSEARSAFEIDDDQTDPPPTSAHDELDGTASIVVAMAPPVVGGAGG
jgi:hypothetical protein